MVKHETYVDLKTAKLLKEAGFDWECMCYYSVNTLHEPNNGFIHIYKQYKELFYDHNKTKMPVYSAPTLAVAQKWLREVKHLDVIINRNFPIHEPQYSWEYEYVIITTDGIVEAVDCYFEEYEEAQEAGIQKCLTLILGENE